MAVLGNDLKRALAEVGLNLVTRAEWGARPPKSTPSPIPLPSPYCYIHHAAIEGSDNAAEMRGHQNFHMDTNGWSDIAYNLAVPDPNPDRVVFEGRGVGIRGGHLLGAENVTSHGILVMGDFNVDRPAENTITVLVDLCRLGRDKDWWNLGLRGHRDSPTITPGKNCPGSFLYPRLPEIRTRIAQEEDLDATERAALLHIERMIDQRTFQNTAYNSSLDDIWRRAVNADNKADATLARVAALESAVAQLGAGGAIDYGRVEQAAEKALKDVLGALDQAG